MDTDQSRLKAVLLFVATITFAVAPFLLPGFGGFDAGDFQIPQDDPPVQPAGYAFAIWGLLYLWLLAHAGWGLFMRSDDAGWDRPRWPLFLSLALGTSWLTVAKAAPLWATALIWAMLGLAIVALLRAPKDRERWLLSAPIALYAGWLTAASWAGVGIMLGGFGVVSEPAAAVIALVGAVALAIWVQTRAVGAPIYGAGVVWALIAIVVANWGSAPVLAGLAALAAAAVGLVALRAGRQPSAVAS